MYCAMIKLVSKYIPKFKLCIFFKAIKTIGSTVYATVYPNFCSDVSQSQASVSSPGIKLQFSGATTTCGKNPYLTMTLTD